MGLASEKCTVKHIVLQDSGSQLVLTLSLLFSLVFDLISHFFHLTLDAIIQTGIVYQISDI